MSAKIDIGGAPESAQLSPLKRAFLALEEAQARVAALEAAAREPIAVVGLGCRVPGGADDSESFWKLMRDGVDAISRVPRERFDIDALHDPDPAVPGRIATREGGFLGAVDGFDAGFFGISPREAQGMDPQQRLLLEVCWEALEHSAQAPDALEKSRTGVYIGAAASDYIYLQVQAGDPALFDAHYASGIAHSVFSGRISYLLGLQGPSVTIDTACSSSLVAVHMACQALRNRECDQALAGGVNLILGPDIYIALSHSRMLAPDGRCKTFDAAADGFGRGEGCGIIVLKRLSDAVAHRDRVLAVINGSAVNQDGPSSGLTAPNGPAQEAVIREALERSGVKPAEVGYIEAHGTGTQLGDPLEVQAIGAVFGSDRKDAPALYLGSVKTNVGHLEAAAGVIGLIKVVLSLQHRSIPKHLHFTAPSPHIPWGDYALQIPTATVDWNPINGRRIAGVSSFGFSGTNAHVVLEEGPRESIFVAPAAPQPAQILRLSARTSAALAALAASYRRALSERSDTEIASICFTANVGRAQFSERAAIVGSSVAEMRAALRALAEGQPHPALQVSSTTGRDPLRVAFLFTGQGAQYPNMARGLYETETVFRTVVDQCAVVLNGHLERPLLEVLFDDTSGATTLDQTAYTQPALFAVECALARLWMSWGVKPAAVLGHSVGEIVAACIAGTLELPDALKLIARRGALMQSLPLGGAMAAVNAPEEVVAACIARISEAVSIAAINGPAQTVISGPSQAVVHVCNALTAQGVRCKSLQVSHAFHSAMMEPIVGHFEDEIRALSFHSPKIPLMSNLTGKPVAADQVTKASYWSGLIRAPVRFAAGLQSLQDLKIDCLIEIGPHPTLTGFAAAVFEDAGPRRIASLKRGCADREQLLGALGAFYCAGGHVDWRALHSSSPAHIVDLPSYPFQREPFWFRAAKAPAASAAGRPSGHPLLGARLRGAFAQNVFDAAIGADSPAFVRDHRVLDSIVVPATAYLDTLIACARNLLKTDRIQIENVSVQEALILKDDGSPSFYQTIAEKSEGGQLQLSISSLGDDADEGPWTTHITATAGGFRHPDPERIDLQKVRAEFRESVTPDAFYADFQALGLHFGESFRSLREINAAGNKALGRIELHSSCMDDASAYALHPVLLDGCLQVMAAALRSDSEHKLYLPVGVGRYTWLGRGATTCWSLVTVADSGSDLRRADLRIFDEQGRPLAVLEDVRLKPVTREAFDRLGSRWLRDALYQIDWLPSEISSTAAPRLSPERLSRAVAGRIEPLRAEVGVDVYDRFSRELHDLCGEYALETLQKLGWQPAPGEVFSAEALAAQLRVRPDHRRLFGRMLAILAEMGLLSKPSSPADGWKVLREAPPVEPGNKAAALARSCPRAAAPELEMTVRVASRFAEALRGEIEPMQLLFPGGSLETAERMYRDSPTARFFNSLIAALSQRIAGEIPVGRPLRILEVGGGTGGTTAHVLPLLTGAGEIEYTFTDVGPLFVSRAQERFSSYEFVRYRTLDLERDPAEQGFGPGQFDVVLASNVIHATRDLRRTLGRIRSTLAPGGVLIMLEVTAPQRWFDLTVGLTQGWWAFTDLDLRPDYALVDRGLWLELLAGAGFDEVRSLPQNGEGTGILALQSIFIARASRVSSKPLVIFSDVDGVGARLATELRARGERAVLVRQGSEGLSGDAAAIDLESETETKLLLETLHRTAGGIRGVIALAPLDSGLSAAIEAPAFALLRLARATVLGAPGARLWALTRGSQAVTGDENKLHPNAAAIWGLQRTLALEHPELSSVCIDLDPREPHSEIDQVIAELQEPGDEQKIAFREGQRLMARLARGALGRRANAGAGQQRPLRWRLVPAQSGSLDAFRYRELPEALPGPDQVEIAVQATGLNFKDVLNALGMYPGNPGPLGGECAGVVTTCGNRVTHVKPGDRVIAVAGGSFSSHVIAEKNLVQPSPPELGAEECAAFPIAFLTADFCLNHCAGMKAGDRVLIHAAAGGVGMAAVRLAQRAGAQIFATAGSKEKRELLHRMGVTNIFDSRTPVFAPQILERTSGEGVDIVLNSLAGDLIEPSFSVLRTGGTFVEIGKRGIKDDAWVDAQGRSWRYRIVDWGETAAQSPELIGTMLEQLVGDLASGKLASLPRHAFAIDQAHRAFRFMAQARHTGKIVVRHSSPAATPIHRHGTYLVTGGLSGLGLLTAEWLAGRGAGRLVLIGRRGVTNEAAEAIGKIRALGCDVIAEAADVADESALSALLARVREQGPPLRGIVHSAGVLDDAALMQQNGARFEKVFRPKATGAALLDRLTRIDPLDWFVLYSSVAAVLGSAGQANHASANAALDALAHARRERGHAALTINWGAWSGTGAAADRGILDRLEGQGFGALSPQQGLQAVDSLLKHDLTQAAVVPIHWNRYLRQVARDGVPAFLRHVVSQAGEPGASHVREPQSTEPRAAQSLREQLAGAPELRRRPIVTAFVREKALHALGLDPAKPVDPRMPLSELGLDSLLAVELRNTLGRSLGATLPATLLFDYSSIEALSGFLCTDVLKVDGVAAGQPAKEESAAAAPVQTVDAIEAMSDEEVDRLIAARTRGETSIDPK